MAFSCKKKDVQVPHGRHCIYLPYLGVCCKKTRMPVHGYVQRDFIAVAEFCLDNENVAKV